MTEPASRARRLRSALARRLDPQAGRTTPVPTPAPTPAAIRRQVRAYLDTLDRDEVGKPMEASIARAFTALWQPERQPVPEPPEPVLRAITDQFHRLYYHVSKRTWKDTWYRGTLTYKCPTDMWVYQELIDKLKPGLVIETGTFRGGSALFIADRLQLAGRGQVVTIDIDVQPHRREHPRLTYLTGSSVDPEILAEVRSRIDPNAPVLVILDSDHSEQHVAAELRAYGPMVTLGSYLIVEDTNVNGHPAAPDHGPGPFEAVEGFLRETSDFEVDRRGERYFLTQNPSGYLRRVRGQSEQVAAETAITSSTDLDPATAPVTRALDRLVFDGETPHVVLVLQAFEPDQFFAGIKTAVLAAAHLADDLGLGLRVLVARQTGSSTHAEALAALSGLVRQGGLDGVADGLRLSTALQPDPGGHTSDDVWMATYWTTGWALKMLARTGRITPDRVVYLIQDFEPGFYPWGQHYAKAFATYDAGFRPLVNSASLASYVADVSPTTPDVAFAPALDVAPLHAAAERWQPAAEGEVRVLFYARPSKPRNMYDAGVEALRIWAERLPDGLTGVVRFAGEPLAAEVDLGPRARVELLGKLSYDGYHELLSDTDVGLALMLSPHPGHLALELPQAGIPTVTNDFAGYRDEWVAGLTVSGTDPASIADGLLAATETARGLTRHVPHELRVDLGVRLDEAVARVAAGLR